MGFDGVGSGRGNSVGILKPDYQISRLSSSPVYLQAYMPIFFFFFFFFRKKNSTIQQELQAGWPCRRLEVMDYREMVGGREWCCTRTVF